MHLAQEGVKGSQSSPEGDPIFSTSAYNQNLRGDKGAIKIDNCGSILEESGWGPLRTTDRRGLPASRMQGRGRGTGEQPRRVQD